MATKKTTKKAASKKEMSTAEKVGIGVGITTAAVAAAGAYFLYGSKSASKNRAKVKSWMLKAKAEALEALENAKEMSQHEYEALIESIGASYATLKDASRNDIAAFKREMKDHWKNIEKSAKPLAKKASKTAKKTTKKAAKTAKEATKKTTKK